MKKTNRNQLSLGLVFEKTKKYKPNRTVNTLAKCVLKALSKRGYSHVFDQIRFNELKQKAPKLTFEQTAEYIADLFIQETDEVSDFNDYLF